MLSNRRILIVSAVPDAALSGLLRDLGHAVCAEAPPAEAADAASEHRPDLVLVDLDGLERAGIEAVERCGVPLVCVVGADDAAADGLLQRGRLQAPCAFAVKPVGARQLRLSIESALFEAERGKRTDAGLQSRVANLERRLAVTETVFDAIDQPVFAVDTRRRPLMMNRAAKGIVAALPPQGAPEPYGGYGIFRMDGRTSADIDDLPLARAIRGEATDDVELRLRRPRDTVKTRCVSVCGRPLRDARGDLIGGVIVVNDITRAKQTEGRLRRTLAGRQAQRRLMRAVLDTMQEGVVALDAQGRRLFLNRAAHTFATTDAAPDAPLDERIRSYGVFRRDTVTPFPLREMPIRRAINGETFAGVEMYMRNPRSPEGRYLRASGAPMRSRSGAVEGGVIVLQDETAFQRQEIELKRTAAELHERSALMDEVFHSMSDGVVVADGQRRLTLVNKSAARLVGFGPDQVGAGLWTDFVRAYHPDQVTPFDEADLPLARALRGQSSDSVEMFLRHPRAPEGVFVGVDGRPLRNEAGDVTGGLVVLRDLSHGRAAREAFVSGRLEVVDVLLHNVGNALTTVTVGVGTLYDGLRQNAPAERLTALAEAVAPHRDDPIPWLRDDPQGRKAIPFLLALAGELSAQNDAWLETVKRVRERVEHIVQVIHTERSLPVGRPEPKVVELRRQIADAAGVLQHLLAQRGIPVEIDCARAPAQIRIDESRFHQMLVNLLRNAMEAIDERAAAGGFDPGETPRIRVAAYLDPDQLVLEVTDNGIGIDPRRLRSIFAAGYTTKQSGTGLGLHSAANFVIGAGGRIAPFSDGPGRGATLRVTFRRSGTLLEPPGGVGGA